MYLVIMGHLGADAVAANSIANIAKNLAICFCLGLGSAGSVVTRDIPGWSLAAGNPCRVIRKITDNDKRKLFRDEEIDEEAWSHIVEKTHGLC